MRSALACQLQKTKEQRAGAQAPALLHTACIT